MEARRNDAFDQCADMAAAEAALSVLGLLRRWLADVTCVRHTQLALLRVVLAEKVDHAAQRRGARAV